MDTKLKFEGFGFASILTVVIGVIGLSIIGSVLTDANFSGLTATVTDNIVPVAALSLLAIAAGALVALR